MRQSTGSPLHQDSLTTRKKLENGHLNVPPGNSSPHQTKSVEPSPKSQKATTHRKQLWHLSFSPFGPLSHIRSAHS